MHTLLRQLIQDDTGQDLIKYSLLAAFIAVGSVAVIISIGSGVNSVYSTSNTSVQAAAAAVGS